MHPHLSQSEHDADPLAAAYVPCEHAAQTAAPVDENRPRSHTSQEAELSFDQVPALHLEHALRAAAEYEPELQTSHTERPVDEAKRPAGHASQPVAPDDD